MLLGSANAVSRVLVAPLKMVDTQDFLAVENELVLGDPETQATSNAFLV